MEIDIMDSLDNLGYPNALPDDAVQTLIDEGLSSMEFFRLVQWLASELQELCNLESCVMPVLDIEEDISSFMLELSTFLKELPCPYDCLMSCPISECLTEKQNRIFLLEFLCTELHCARIIAARRFFGKQVLDIEMESTPAASCLSSILKTLEICRPVEFNSDGMFSTIHDKLEDIILLNPEALKEPVFPDELTDSQWTELEKIQEEMQEDYTTRRDMILTRLDVVALSFKWGENSKGKEEKMHKIYQPLRRSMKTCPNVDISDVLASRQDILCVEKTSSGDSVMENMKSSVYKVIIPQVPDRGGRANEQRPPVEMPSWQKRSDGGGRGGRGQWGGGHRGDHRGGGRRRR